MTRRTNDGTKTARTRALRAARAVTLGLGMASAGCGSSTTSGEDAAAKADLSGAVAQDMAVARDLAMTVDLAEPEDLTVVDLRVARDLAQPVDMTGGRDGVCPPGGNPSDDPDCCDQLGGFWVQGGGCAVPGPFVPPALDHDEAAV